MSVYVCDLDQEPPLPALAPLPYPAGARNFQPEAFKDSSFPPPASFCSASASLFSLGCCDSSEKSTGNSTEAMNPAESFASADRVPGKLGFGQKLWRCVAPRLLRSLKELSN